MANENERSICKITIARMLIGLAELIMILERSDGALPGQWNTVLAQLDNELRGIKEESLSGVYRRPAVPEDFPPRLDRTAI